MYTYTCMYVYYVYKYMRRVDQALIDSISAATAAHNVYVLHKCDEL